MTATKNNPLIEPDYQMFDCPISESPVFGIGKRDPVMVDVPAQLIPSVPVFPETSIFLKLCIEYLTWLESLPRAEQKSLVERHITAGSITCGLRCDTFKLHVLNRTLSIKVMIDVAEWQGLLTEHQMDACALLHSSILREVRMNAEEKLKCLP